jgi:hypothetical protein
LESLKRKQKDLEEWEQEREQMIAKENLEKEQNQKELIELAIQRAKHYKHKGLDNMIDVESQEEIENILMENSAILIRDKLGL